MTYTQQDQDRFLAAQQERIAADTLRIHLAITTNPDVVAKALAELVNAWGVAGTYEMADQFTCSELEGIAGLLEAIEETRFADAFRWGHAQSHDELLDDDGQLDVDPELIEEFGERHFIYAPITEVNQLIRFVTPGMVEVHLPEQDVQA